MDLVSARKNMVDSQVRTSDVTNTAIHSAMLNTAREDFCAPERAFAAYADAVVPIAAGRSLMRSRETAKLLQALKMQDQYLAGSILMFVSLLTIVGMFVSDLLLAWLDPRIRMGGKGR